MEWLKELDPQWVVLTLSILVWACTWLTKTKAGLGVFNKLSAKWRRVIPVAFAALGTALYQLESGVTVADALRVGLMTAAVAVFGNEFVAKGLLRPADKTE